SNIIAWTSIDEQIHANAGIFLVNKIREEFPDMFDQETTAEITRLVRSSIEVESRIIDWIFSEGEIHTITKDDLILFMKYRADDSLQKIGLPRQFNLAIADVKLFQWFEEEVFANSLDDFFE